MPTFTHIRNTIKPKGKIVYEYNPLYNYRPTALDGEIDDLITTGSSQLNFDLEHPVDIVCQKSYDGSINLILNDNKNQPRLINTRFTAKENNTYERVDRTGNTDTNLYDESEFEIDTSLLKKYINIPKVNLQGVYYGGNLPVGNYTFYFKLSDGDGNETDIVAESGIVTIHMGSLGDPLSIRGGQFNENSGKAVQFILTNVDSGYDYVSVYYSRATGADNLQRTVQAVKILNRFRIRQNVCNIHITGNENVEQIPVEALSQNFFLASAAKTQEVCQNMLFLGNVQKYTPDYETLAKLSLGFVPFYEVKSEQEELGSVLTESYASGGYYDVNNIYNKVGYWNEELYRFGIVYIMSNGSLSPVYNIRGTNNVRLLNSFITESNTYTGQERIDFVNRLGFDQNWDNLSIDYDTQMINNVTLENSAGVCRIDDTTIPQSGDYFQVRHFVFRVQHSNDPEKDVITQLKKLNIKGYFFVRQKRIPTILCQAFLIGRDRYSGIPCWSLKKGSSSIDSVWLTESFISSDGHITHSYEDRMVILDKNKVKVGVGICPEFELNQAYYNNIFTGSQLKIKPVSKIDGGLNGEPHHLFVKGNYPVTPSDIIKAKVTSVPDSGLVRDGNDIFRNVAGSANENTFQYLVNETNKPKKDNFDRTVVRVEFVNGIPNFTESTSESRVKIVRGLYGPYVGIYGSNVLKENSLVNIYIPGYDVNQMYEYFKIRINCEDAYYPVSPRTSINEFPEEGEHIYRGDCFISQFTHRINRNFQDPDAPTNDTIVEEDTWREKYDEDTNSTSDINRGDLNAVRLGTYITIKCYSSINLAMRDWDGSFPSEEALTGNKRGFYPLSSLRVDGHSKIPESVMYNQGFSSTTGERMNFLQPAVPFIKNTFQTRVIYSDIAQTDAFKNGFRVFKGISYVDYSNQYGGITKLVEWNGDLIIIFEHGIALAKVNQNALIPTDDGTQIAVGAIKPLATTPIMISTDFGTQWPDSVCKTDKYVYGIDTVGKKIWRTDGTKLECISDFKVQKFLNENITLSEKELTPILGVRNVKTHYNAFKHDVMFTYYDNTYGFEEKVWNLCWNELQQAFITFYSWIPSFSSNIDNIYFTYDRNSSKWISKLSQSTYGSRNIGLNIDFTPDSSSAYELVSGINPLPSYDPEEIYYIRSGSNPNYTYTQMQTGVTSSNYTQYYIKRSDILENENASGVCMINPLIPSNGVFSRNLYLKNRPIPDEGTVSYSYELIRDNFGFYKYFTINSGNLILSNYSGLLSHWMTINNQVKDSIIPCIQLNIRCNISVTGTNSDPNSWNQYQTTNAGFYESQVFITLFDIYNNSSRTREEGRWSSREVNTLVLTNPSLTINLPTFETKFWKHGFAGLIDAQDRIKPCFWYGKQHPFEFEYVTGNDNAGYKQFDNLQISSNNVAPESVHYTIIGDSYDFALQKPSMYFRQEATKAFYQFNGADLLYDHDVFDKINGYLPEMITTSDYIERDQDGNPLRNSAAVSTFYKDTLFPIIFMRQDTFNEVEDYYKKMIASLPYSDYPNISGGEILWDQTLDQFSICNHVKCRDIKEVGRSRGNIQYVNDKWSIQISPLIVLNRNNTWIQQNGMWLPMLVLSNVPQSVYTQTSGNITNVDFPPELGVKNNSWIDNTTNPATEHINLDDNYLIGSKGIRYNTQLLDGTPWDSIANKRLEVKLLDKVLKTRIRYKGDKLVIVLATATSFNTIA